LNIIISQYNPDRINVSLSLRQYFQNSVVLNDAVKVRLLTCQTFMNSPFHFLFIVESATSKVSLYRSFHNNEEFEMAFPE